MDHTLETAVATRTTRTHGFRGKAFIVLNYLGAALWAVMLIVILAVGADGDGPGLGAWEVILLVPLFGGLAALLAVLAYGVSRFRPWSRLLALVILWLGAAGQLMSLLVPDEPSSALVAIITIPVTGAFLHYFHSRKALFQAD